LWEESGEWWERLYVLGIDRDVIDRAFERAGQLGAHELCLTKEQVQAVIARLELSPDTEEELTDRLYYLAGHYYSPRFHKLFGDDPVSARRHLKSVAATAAKLQRLTSGMSASVMRNFNAVRLQIHARRRGLPFMEWSDVVKEIVDIEEAARTVEAEFPVQKRGTNPKVLQGRWLRHAAEAIEKATGATIETAANDSAGKNHRLLSPGGVALLAYCRTVDRRVAVKTIVEAVRTFHRVGIGRPPS
jgi:hypothetical protein